jgi:hypothetical protein
MADDLHLCPCCAAHLRVDVRLHVMRCDNCDAELVFLRQGGVRGLAMLPPFEGIIPYSHPAQRQGHFDGREYLSFRRALVSIEAERARRFWSRLFFGAVALLTAMVVGGVAGVDLLLQGPRERAEDGALLFLTAISTLPILAYVALYFQGRARLAHETMKHFER